MVLVGKKGGVMIITKEMYLRAIDLLCDKMVEDIEDEEVTHEYEAMNEFGNSAKYLAYMAMREVIRGKKR